MSTETQTHQKTTTGIRKRPFAVPPVKVACLSCRSSRIRCDGKEPCSGCHHRGKECVYVQSRRGGARVPRSKRQEHEKVEYVKIAQEYFDDAVPTMVQPGAGLTQLDLDFDDTDTLFDSIFTAVPVPQDIELESHTPRQPGSVRVYRSDEDILDAYYIWLHPYFPILPPAITSQPKDDPHLWFPQSSEPAFVSLSPAALAISAILALIPHPDETAPFEQESIIARREAANKFAKRTLESIETDSEMPNSSISPAQALLDEHACISRPAFHPCVPLELESVVALNILSVYEYAQRGNIAKMRDRAGQALMRAMDLSLHDRGTELDFYTEARRRTWWMTYICICQASIVSSAPPAIPLFDSRFTTSFPQSPDPEAWPFFVKSQQNILLATQFVTAVGLAVDGKGDWTEISSRMQDLHNTIQPLVSRCDKWIDIKPPATDIEALVAYSLKQMSKIKLNSAMIKIHRYCAFYDIPVFSESHCDLKKSLTLKSSPPPCGCGPSLPTQNTSLATPVSTSVSPTSSNATTEYFNPFPATNSVSSRWCLESALAIVDAFEALPLPEASAGYAPRTMPSFACCAMQSAYTLLMVYHRTWAVSRQQESQLQDQETPLQTHLQPSPRSSPPEPQQEQQQAQIQLPYLGPPPFPHEAYQRFLQQHPRALQLSRQQISPLSPEQQQERARLEAQRQANLRAFQQSHERNRFEHENSTPQQAQERARQMQERLQLRAQLEEKVQIMKQEQQMKLLATCEEGLRRILAVLEDYGVVFEAVGGMREQVRVAVDCLDLV